MSHTMNGQTHPRKRVPIPIRAKLLAALVVPLIAVAVLCYFQVSQARDHVAEVEEETSLARVALAPGGLVDALITEQGDAVVTLLGLRDTATIPTENFDASMADTDRALSDFRAGVANGGPIAQDLFAPTLETIESDLADLRAQFTELDAVAETESRLVNLVPVLDGIYPAYSSTIVQLLAANDALAAAISDPEMRAAAQTLSAVNYSHFNISRLSSAVGTSLLRSGNDGRDPVVRYLVEFEESIERLRASRNGPWREAVDAFAENDNYQQLIDRAHDFLKTGEIDLDAYIQLNPPVESRETAELGTTQRVAVTTDRELTKIIEGQLDDARSEERRYTLVGLGIFAVAAAAALLVARSIIKPMRSLTDQAEEMASTTLPAAVASVLETPPDQDVVIPQLEPISVTSRDELQTVAEAINHVQSSALSLAVEQATLRRNIADSFVSLGRRTQNLIGLQLEQITRLEHDETDPAVLESLYRLDHLATRARRNAESLVVLGGTTTSQTSGSPVAMNDVVRAMLSEVDAYQRVDIAQVDEAFVSGGAAADVIHLLAELVENGLSFSPPDTDVLVEGRLEASGYRINVVDSGVGMTAERLQQANRRLSDNESFTIAPSRYLGHYVAGKLARRVGAQVSLASGANKGVVATVFLPSSALASARPTQPATASTPAAGPSAGQPTSDTAPGARLQDTSVDHADSVRVDGRPPAAPAASRPAASPSNGHPEPREASAPADPVPAQVPAAAAPPSPSPSPAAPAPAELTGSGLRKRTPGVHAQAVRERSPLLRSAAARAAEQGQLGAETTPQAAENLASLLSDYTSGLERGREDLADLSTTNTEHSE